MNSVGRQLSGYLTQPSQGLNLFSRNQCQRHQVQQWRGIRVKVFNGNLEQALSWMQRKMQSSGIERLIKREQRHHIKNSEKRVLARKNLERKIRSQDLARKLKAILVKKVRLSVGDFLLSCPTMLIRERDHCKTNNILMESILCKILMKDMYVVVSEIQDCTDA
ncbi:hypothetical protein CUMW_020690 [Citrus unshiu]|nr:hypothetical protein CUMW_020690 [Citrus unshiu]